MLMSRRDAATQPDSATTPGERTPAEPSDDEQQPDDQPDQSPAGDEPDDQQGDADGADQADQGAANDDQGKPIDWKAKHDEVEAKRRDFESKAATAENDRKRWESHAQTVDSWWRDIVKRDAPELFAKISEAEGKRSEAGTNDRAVRAESYAAIAAVYREGEKGFGDYLTNLVEDGVKLTPQSIARHKTTYLSIKGDGGSNNGNGNGAPDRTGASSTPAGGSSAPPRVPAAGRAPADNGAPAWKPGQPFDVRGNLSRGLSESARRRQQGRR